jgi:hypothetical protein
MLNRIVVGREIRSNKIFRCVSLMDKIVRYINKSDLSNEFEKDSEVE